MAQNYDFQSSGWTAAAPATGAEQVFGLDAAGNLAAMPLKGLRTPGLFNGDLGAKLPRWRRALARRKSLTGQARVAIMGDSLSSSAYSDPSGNTRRAYSWPTILAADLTAAGIPASADNIFCDSGVVNGSTSGAITTGATPYSTFDPRVTLGSGSSGWQVHGLSTGTESLGGTMFYSNGTSGAVLSFAPTGPVDTFDIYYAAGFGSMTASVDGGAASAAFPTSGSGMIKQTISAGSLGTHTLALTTTSTTSVYLIGIVGYSTTSPKVSLLNMGWASAETTDWVLSTGGFNPLPALETLAPDLVLIVLGGNDCAKGVPTATTLANLNTMVSGLLPTSDVALATLFPQNPASSTYPSATLANQAAVNQQIYSVAMANDLPVIDLSYRFKSWSAASALGEVYNDLHPNNLGYNDIASAFRPLFSF